MPTDVYLECLFGKPIKNVDLEPPFRESTRNIYIKSAFRMPVENVFLECPVRTSTWNVYSGRLECALRMCMQNVCSERLLRTSIQDVYLECLLRMSIQGASLERRRRMSTENCNLAHIFRICIGMPTRNVYAERPFRMRASFQNFHAVRLLGMSTQGVQNVR